ncbi:MAG: hypothetical protein BWY06_00593 [Candidatus Latescibacteria bacterium ADurb.Bin168]|nr:MAG: hypothetical protein BWY06_00593 [Candidatus Latescibacteria bacterium ADurb.Bin168]
MKSFFDAKLAEFDAFGKRENKLKKQPILRNAIAAVPLSGRMYDTVVAEAHLVAQLLHIATAGGIDHKRHGIGVGKMCRHGGILACFEDFWLRKTVEPLHRLVDQAVYLSPGLRSFPVAPAHPLGPGFD